jgi:hypothetical protein
LTASSKTLAKDAAIIAAVHGLACIVVRALGFDHVSDDDFARVTIAQTFAHAPRIDPSGTSWLPFPFWAMGSLMIVFGRSLAVARATSIALASVAACTPYLALRSSDVPRGRALLASAFAFATPWCLWSGAATVPESFTASFTAAGAIGLATTTSRRVVTLSCLALVAACLSRYESWPVAGIAAVALLVRAREPRARRAVLLGAGLCVLAPFLWMAWNAHAHDGPLHFFRRVSTFKRAIGAGSTDTASALLEYPILLVTTRPEVVIPALFVIATKLRDRALRDRWLLPLLGAASQLAFLAYGNARDGAPAHHAERALLVALMILALFVADAGLVRLREIGGGTAKAGAACVAVAWVISSFRGSEMPGRGSSDDRRDQIARGQALRGSRSLVLQPCAFEHFALIAAYGAPENVEVKPTTGGVMAPECPEVEVR